MNAAAPGQPPPTLEDRLRDVQRDLMQVARRQYALEAFVKELDRATRLKPFRICNDILWTVVLDSRDMLVIHLASLVKGACASGGLMRQLKEHHLPELPAARRPTERTDDDSYLRGILDSGHQEAFSRLFPAAKGPQATGSDLDALTKRLRLAAEPLLKDRNQNRAHAFERRGRGSAKMLELSELRNTVTFIERLLNDLSLVGHSSTTGHHDMNDADCDVVAEEMVESIIIGSSARREILMEGRDRDTFYKVLHDRHDALPSGSRVLFNDNYE
jgi:hypothetical protein